MKLNNKQPIFRILSLAVLFCLLFTACTPQVSPGSSGVGTPSGGTESSASEEIKSGYGERISFWCDWQFPGIPHRRMEGVDEEVYGTVREIDYSGGELKANFLVINELANDETDVLELGLMVFCDGVPIEYTLLDTGKTGLYEILRVEGEEMQTFQLAFTPDFDLNLGRIDFQLVPQPYMNPSPLRQEPYPFHTVLPEGYAAQGTYSNVIGDVEDGQIVAMPELLKNTKSEGMTELLVMDPGEKETVGGGTTMYRIGGKEETWVCVYVPAPGKYRLVFLLDGKPFALEEGKTVLNCKFGEDEMFSAVVPLKQMIPPGEHSLAAIATRVDDQSFQTRQSCLSVSSERKKITN